jgi:hypothetical protein
MATSDLSVSSLQQRMIDNLAIMSLEEVETDIIGSGCENMAGLCYNAIYRS